MNIPSKTKTTYLPLEVIEWQLMTQRQKEAWASRVAGTLSDKALHQIAILTARGEGPYALPDPKFDRFNYYRALTLRDVLHQRQRTPTEPTHEPDTSPPPDPTPSH